MVDGERNQPDKSVVADVGSFACPIDARPDELLKAMDRDVCFAWSEPGGPTTIGYGTCVSLRDDQSSLDSVRERGMDVLDRVNLDTDNGREVPDRVYPRFFGGVAFSSEQPSGLWAPFGQAQFFLPELQFTFTTSSAWLTVTERNGDGPSSRRETAERVRRCIRTCEDRAPAADGARQLDCVNRTTADRREWQSMVEEALSAIDRGEVQKVVLAQRRELEFGRPFALDRLQEWLFDAPDSSYRFLFRPGPRTAFVGRSPECIVQKQGNEVRTESVGGTIETGTSKMEQEQLAEQLVENRKDQLEHSLVVRSIRDHLAPYVDQVSEEEQTVRVLSNVQHLCTPIHARLTEDRHVLDLVDVLHPTSAIGGYPRENALQLIHRLESFNRGWYGGPVGWFDRAGDGCFAVGIRSGLMSDRNVYLYAGAGIVEGSEPEREWEEVQWKFESMTSLLTERFSPARSS